MWTLALPTVSFESPNSFEGRVISISPIMLYYRIKKHFLNFGIKTVNEKTPLIQVQLNLMRDADTASAFRLYTTRSIYFLISVF